MFSNFGWGWFAGILAAVLTDALLTYYGVTLATFVVSLVVCVIVYSVFLIISGEHNGEK